MKIGKIVVTMACSLLMSSATFAEIVPTPVDNSALELSIVSKRISAADDDYGKASTILDSFYDNSTGKAVMNEQIAVYVGAEKTLKTPTRPITTQINAYDNKCLIKDVNFKNQHKNPAMVRVLVKAGYWVTKKVIEYVVVQTIVDGVVKPTCKKVIKYVKEWVPPVYEYRPSSPVPHPNDSSLANHPGHHPLKQFPVAGSEALINGDIR